MVSFFMPRQAGDRPAVVPEGAVKFAFIGQFAETTRDCIFTTEYSVRTGMEAAYQLLGKIDNTEISELLKEFHLISE
nr:oleate hydratase [Dictyobacter kobayashii]